MRWFDVDYPEVIDLRRRLYPERPGYRLIGSSLADLHWLDQVPGERPAMIVAEGLMMYLTEDIVKRLLNGLTGHFPFGQMVFDAVNRQGAKLDNTNANLRAAGATFGWWIDDPRDIQRLDPKFELVTELRPIEAYGYDRLPGLFHVLLPVMDWFPSLRRLNRLLRYQF